MRSSTSATSTGLKPPSAATPLEAAWRRCQHCPNRSANVINRHPVVMAELENQMSSAGLAVDVIGTLIGCPNREPTSGRGGPPAARHYPVRESNVIKHWPEAASSGVKRRRHYPNRSASVIKGASPRSAFPDGLGDIRDRHQLMGGGAVLLFRAVPGRAGGTIGRFRCTRSPCVPPLLSSADREQDSRLSKPLPRAQASRQTSTAQEPWHTRP